MIYDTMNLPHEEFGQGVTRQVRLIASPETTGETRVSLVYTIVPPGAVSEGHIHADFDEYIFFESKGQAVLDGKAFDVPAKAVVHAAAGMAHECRNTSTEEDLRLFCVFVPPLKPYGGYDALIAETNAYLKGMGMK